MQLEQFLVGDARRAADVDHPRRLEVGLGVDGLVGLGDRKAHRAADAHEEVQVDAGHLRRPAATCKRSPPTITRSAGRKITVPFAVRAPQLRERHAFGGELFEQGEALLALLALQPVEQALGGEVDPLGAHLQRSVCHPAGAGRQASGARAQNHRRMIVLGIDPGLANTGYGVVGARDGRLVALDGGVIETPRGRAARAAPGRRSTRAVAELIDEHEPDAVALEELYFGAERAHARSRSGRRAAW